MINFIYRDEGMRVRTQLKDIASFSKGKQINGDELLVSGKYDYLNGGVLPSGKWNEYNTAGKTVTISEGGNSCGFVNFMEKPFWCGAHCYYLFEPKINAKYLYYALKSQQSELMKIRSGACMPNIKKNDLGKFEIIYDTDINEQFKTIKVLDTVSLMIVVCQKQLQKLDELVKSRFIEMFGTLSYNEHHYPMCALKDACRKITDGKHGGCEQEYNSGYYYVGAREIYDGEIHYDTAPQIVRGDFEKDYRRCNLEQGDFVLVNTGATIGKSAIAKHPLTERTLLQKSVAMFKVKTELISAVFLKCCYDANPEMYTVKSASAQPNLLLSRINSTQIYLPPIELQRQFAAFVEQVDKSKFAVQQTLDKAQILFDSLMQKYFG